MYRAHTTSALPVGSLGKERKHETAYSEAAEHFGTALALLERWKGPNHISLAEVLDSLGDLARRQKVMPQPPLLWDPLWVPLEGSPACP